MLSIHHVEHDQSSATTPFNLQAPFPRTTWMYSRKIRGQSPPIGMLYPIPTSIACDTGQTFVMTHKQISLESLLQSYGPGRRDHCRYRPRLSVNA